MSFRSSFVACSPLLRTSLSLLAVGVIGCGTSDPEPATTTQPTASTSVTNTSTGIPNTTQSTAPNPTNATSSSPTTSSQAPSPSSSSPTSDPTSIGSTSGGSDQISSTDLPVESEPTATTNEPVGSEATTSAEPEPGTSGDDTSEPDPTPSNCAPNTDEWAPAGYGASATGGGNASPVTVSSFAEAEAALEAYRDAFDAGEQNQLVLRYTGTFDYSTISDVCAQHSKDSQILYIKEMENVTFEGAPGSSANFGIKINRAKNVIVRNMTLGLLPGGGDSDAITIEGNGTNGDVEHVWIDHNDLFSSTKDDCDGAGDTEFDGLIDIKKGARYITVSYNHLHDHQKTGLLGSSDSDDMDRYVTFHHNWYENVVSRTPLHRFGYIHMYNNYFDRILDSGINVRMGGVALIEANYFENTANPVTSRYSDEVGYWDLRDNHVGANVTWSLTEDTLANADDWQSTTTFPAAELTYSYEPDAAECAKAIVMARAGATL